MMKSELNFMKAALFSLVMLFMANEGIAQLDPNQSRVALPSNVASKYETAPYAPISDDFNGTSVDQDHWGYRSGNDNGTGTAYVDIETNGSDSYVSILGDYSTLKGSGLGSRVKTKYGFYVTRWSVTGIPDGGITTGWHPAIWGAACNFTTPRLCNAEASASPSLKRIEIDWMEAYNGRPTKWDSHLLTWENGIDGGASFINRTSLWPNNETDEWFTFGLEYTEDYIAVWRYSGTSWTLQKKVRFQEDPINTSVDDDYRTECFWMLTNKKFTAGLINSDTELHVDYFYFYPVTPPSTDPYINPIADAYVKGGINASTNYGSATNLEVKETSDADWDRMSFLKFDLSTIPAVSTAKIRLKLISKVGATNTHDLYSVADDSWTESGITWSNKPSASSLIDTKQTPGVDNWIEFDVTALVNNEIGGIMSVRISDPNAEKFVEYFSKETAYAHERPQLVYQVNTDPPVAAFSADVVSGQAPLGVNFTDQSVNSPSSWSWDFDGDGTEDATTQNPNFTYSTPGVYTVELTATNVFGSDTETKTNYITVTVLPSSTSISPLADAYVKGGTDASNNFGTAATLAVKESSAATFDRMSFLKFDLSTISGSLSSAKVRLKVSRKVNATGASHDLSLVTDDSWTESGVTWSNQPSASSIIDTQPVPAVDDWIEFDVTSFAIAEQTGVLSVRLSDANAPEDLVEYYSMEATNAADRPQLTYQLSGPSGPLTPVADAYGKGGSNASTNYGAQTTIEVKESTNATFDRRSFLKFDKSGIGTVSNATLRLKVETRNASTSHSLHLVTSDSWTETGLTWNNQPSASTLIATQTVPAVGSWIEFDVTAELNNEIDDLLSLRLSNSTSNEAFVKYHSKEATNAADRPQLVYTLTGGARIADSGNLNKELTDVVEESIFSIYPNPASDQINLVGSGLKGARVELIDLSGKSVLHKELTEDSTSILKLDEVQKGVYFLKIIKREGETITRKIIVD